MKRQGNPHAAQDSPSSDILSGVVIDRTCRTSNLDELTDVLNSLVTSHRLIPSNRGVHCDGEFGFHGLSHLAVFNVRYGRQTAVELMPEETGRVSFVMTRQGSSKLRLGRSEFAFSEKSGVVFPSGPSRVLHFEEATEHQAVLMDPRTIADYCAKLLGRDVEGFVEFETEFPFASASGQSWLRLVDYAASELSTPESLVRHFPMARQHLEQMVITGLLLGHSHNYSDALFKPQSAAAPYYVKQAEAYIEHHFADPMSLADIAAHAGVSARSLQNGFQNFRNLTPMAFLRSVRLQHAYRALIKADPSISTVTGIALSCGFSHMGEFSAMYRRAFGETPRQTLLTRVRA
jgi:AraC-like DNA-binding protein